WLTATDRLLSCIRVTDELFPLALSNGERLADNLRSQIQHFSTSASDREIAEALVQDLSPVAYTQEVFDLQRAAALLLRDPAVSSHSGTRAGLLALAG